MIYFSMAFWSCVAMAVSSFLALIFEAELRDGSKNTDICESCGKCRFVNLMSMEEGFYWYRDCHERYHDDREAEMELAIDTMLPQPRKPGWWRSTVKEEEYKVEDEKNE